ncbi:BON domain-containing protein [Acidovorax sp. D2M1]|uniref:BON domain-containing protein n=1 Tax=Acidovorax benzenivorans TaxID=2987520 RepID=A0ABT5S251_9BURK|nr:BON domain-containing protein [Acidovorax benzenivorans]MDD2180031.1 BON domain-containing protein [Acidovorax benzenivorans]
MRDLTLHTTHHPPPRNLCTVLVVLALLPLGCKRSDMVAQWAPASSSPVAHLEDGVIASRVRTALILSPVVNSHYISVESHQSVVLLSGMAANPTQIDLAVFVAQTVPGVKSVESFMFSNGTVPALAVHQGHTPDLQALRAKRLLGPAPSQLYPERYAQAGVYEPSGPSSAVYIGPLPQQPLPEPESTNNTPPKGMFRPSR